MSDILLEGNKTVLNQSCKFNEKRTKQNLTSPFVQEVQYKTNDKYDQCCNEDPDILFLV